MVERKQKPGRGPVLDLENYVPGLLLWLSNKVSSSASMLYKDKFAIGVTEWRLLSYFKLYPGTTAAEASELMGLDKGGVSRALAKLVQNGFLVSAPLGKRQIVYEISEAGRVLHDQVYEFAMLREQALLDGLSKDERALLIKMFKRMLANLDKLNQIGR